MSGDEPEAPWKTLDSDLVYDGSPWIKVFKETLATGRGKRVDDFHRVEARDFVLLFARTMDARVVMVRQWRQGPRRFALCFPGGHLEPGEDPAETARRELAEEAGFKVDTVRPLGQFCMHSNFGVGWGHFYSAEDAAEIRSIRNPDLEITRPRLLTRFEIEAALHSGEIATVHDALCARLALAIGG